MRVANAWATPEKAMIDRVSASTRNAAIFRSSGRSLFSALGAATALAVLGFLAGCAGAKEYRWLKDGVEIFAFPGPSCISEKPLV